jgi:hypothetical protein
MKDYYGKRIPLRWRWEAFTQDLREDLAIYGLRQLVGGIWDWRWHKYVVNHWLRSPLGTFIRKGRRYDVVVSCRELTDLLRAHEAQDNAEIWELRSEVYQVYNERDLLRTALEISCYGHDSQLELLLAEAKATIHREGVLHEPI